MSDARYQPDRPIDANDALIVVGSGPTPPFDDVTQAFLMESYKDVKRRCERGGLLDVTSLGIGVPWLYRLTFHTHGLVRDSSGEVTTVDEHVVALRFSPDYLRHADRFAMLRLIQPIGVAFHPNVSSVGAICIEVYPGEPLIEICQSLHDLFRWRLRQYDERDALNSDACAWGRENIDHPIDDRPLFGQRSEIQWQPSARA